MMLRLRILFSCLFLTASCTLLAQEVYIIDKDTLELKKEVNGRMSLFWNAKSWNNRFFVQKKNRMVELKDSLVNGVPQYRQELDSLTKDTDMYTNDVQFTLSSLRNYVNRYNSKIEEDYIYNASTSHFRQRLGFFTGISNNIYVDNPENVLVPILGVELELYDSKLAPRHSAVVQLRQSFKRPEFRYSSTQLSLLYRYRFIRISDVVLHLESRIASMVYAQDETPLTNDAGEVVEMREEDGLSFKAPLSFGVGGQFKITEKGSVTFGYNDVVSILLDSNGSFPIDLTVGYKYEL